MERTDDDGRWVSDDGAAWTLVEPSRRFLENRQVAEPDREPDVRDLKTRLDTLTEQLATARSFADVKLAAEKASADRVRVDGGVDGIQNR